MILVFGSINADYVFALDALPAPGQTALASGLEILAGGKGANQALAAARAGAPVALFGAVGQDGNATVALRGLHEAGVDVGGVREVARATGMASIGVDARGENVITVFPGANGEARANQVSDEAMGEARLLVMQMEVPAAQIEALAARGAAAGTRVLLNLAPAVAVSRTTLDALDYLIVNEGELAALGEQQGGATDGTLDQLLASA